MGVRTSIARWTEKSGLPSFFRRREKPSPPLRFEPSPEAVRQARKLLKRILNDNIIAFWYPRALDLECGGYRIPQKSLGNGKFRADKLLVSQARSLWFFSRLVNSDRGTDEFRQAAAMGYDFLREKMWDKKHGGFYWQVDASGNRPTQPGKHLYGQAFGLYALSEYADASGDSSAKSLAQTLFDLMEIHAHDREFGGFRESFLTDWQPVPADQPSYLTSSGAIKLMNTHLHLLEALTRYYLTTQNPSVKERLFELIFVGSNSVVRKNIGACSDRHRRSWEPLSEREDNRVSYGHDVENVWLLLQACNAVGLPVQLLLDLCRTLFGYAMRYGFDWKKGGFYESGPFNDPADRREKIYWVQAECLIAALQMYRLTGEQIYWSCFTKTLNWIHQYQADWQDGDWHIRVSPGGAPLISEPYAWSSAYHNGRAMLICLELLPCE